MMGTMAAARTRRLRIGTAVSLAPFYNPLRLAEEVALLDVLSGGRVNWGAGRGFERSEFAAFGIPGRGKRAALPRDGRHRAEGLDEPAAHLRGQILPLRRRRGAAQAIAGAASAGLDGGVVHAGDRVGGEPGPLDPDGPACIARRTHPQAQALCGEAGRGRPQRRRPHHPDGAAGRRRRDGREGARGGEACGGMDGRLLCRPAAHRQCAAGAAAGFRRQGSDRFLSGRRDDPRHRGERGSTRSSRSPRRSA